MFDWRKLKDFYVILGNTNHEMAVLNILATVQQLFLIIEFKCAPVPHRHLLFFSPILHTSICTYSYIRSACTGKQTFLFNLFVLNHLGEWCKNSYHTGTCELRALSEIKGYVILCEPWTVPTAHKRQDNLNLSWNHIFSVVCEIIGALGNSVKLQNRILPSTIHFVLHSHSYMI